MNKAIKGAAFLLLYMPLLPVLFIWAVLHCTTEALRFIMRLTEDAEVAVSYWEPVCKYTTWVNNTINKKGRK